MKEIGVIGAGVMGRGVAHNLATAGYLTVLVDVSSEALTIAKDEIYNSMRMQMLFKKDEDNIDPDALIERIIFTTDYNLLKDAVFVIENVPEKWEIKRQVYEKTDGICLEGCIFLVNTSCIPITRVAALTKRPDRVIGTHFMNPVPMKTTIEVIRGYHTSDETVNAVKEFLGTMGKECIIVNDLPGFVSNRISHLFMNEAAFVVQDQVASPEQVDEIFRSCFGHRMGPLETADLIGLDTVVDSLKVLYESYQDPKFRCCPLLKKMVQAGLLGRKTGEGFFKY